MFSRDARAPQGMGTRSSVQPLWMWLQSKSTLPDYQSQSLQHLSTRARAHTRVCHHRTVSVTRPQQQACRIAASAIATVEGLARHNKAVLRALVNSHRGIAYAVCTRRISFRNFKKELNVITTPRIISKKSLAPSFHPLWRASAKANNTK